MADRAGSTLLARDESRCNLFILAADPATGGLYGAVAYAYQIGKYEVTNGQYTGFLNAADATGANANGIYNTSMGSDARGGITFTMSLTRRHRSTL